MSDKLQKAAAPSTSSAAPATQQSAPSADAQDQLGNSFIQQQTGKMTYEAALGQFLGSKLYDAISDKISDEELIGYAQSAVGSATGALNDYLQGNVSATDQEAAQKFVQALDGELKRVAGQFMTESGLADGIQGFVDDNPIVIATAAVAAAATYILTNQDIPLIDTKKSFGDGHSVIAGIDPGRTMEFALEQVRVGYRYQSAGTNAELMGDYFQDGYQVQGSLQQQLGGYGALSAGALHSERDGATKDRLDLGYSNSALAASAYYERMRTGESDLSKLGGRINNVADPGQIQAYLRGETRSDGSWEAAAGVSKDVDSYGWGVEGFANQNTQGMNDQGVRAVFRMSF